MKTLRQNPTTQQTTSAMELIVSISKPISSLGETLTVGHHRTKHPGRGAVAQARADHPAHLLLSTQAQTGTHLASWSTSVKTNTSYVLQTGRLNKAFSLRSKWKKTHGKTSLFFFFFCTVLIAKENQETGRPLVITSETSAEIGSTTWM